MNLSLHQLRNRSRALAHGLLLVLLATWLSAVCPHCLAQAAPAKAMPGHCHHAAMQMHMESAGDHGCCPQAPTKPACGGDDCMQLSAVTIDESPTVAVPAAAMQAVVPGVDYSAFYPISSVAASQIAYAAPPDPCPLYLRHCVFRN